LTGACTACAVFAASAGKRRRRSFYRGKRLNLMITCPRRTDRYRGRLLAKHLVKHIDGHPGIWFRTGRRRRAGRHQHIGEIAPGTHHWPIWTSPAWRSVVDPEVYRVDFRDLRVHRPAAEQRRHCVRADLPPGVKRDTDFRQAQALVAAGLAADTSKDLLLRLTLDMLGLPYRYVTGYRSSNAARLAVQRGEASMHSESLPGYFGMVEPNLVRNGEVIPTWYDPSYDGKAFSAPKVLEGASIVPFPDFYRKVKGGAPSGILWDVYRANLAVDQSMLRAVVMPPGSPPAAIDALRAAIARLNEDPNMPRGDRPCVRAPYETGADSTRVRNALVVAPASVVRRRLSEKREPVMPLGSRQGWGKNDRQHDHGRRCARRF
jgi:hypothetical protein